MPSKPKKAVSNKNQKKKTKKYQKTVKNLKIWFTRASVLAGILIFCWIAWFYHNILNQFESKHEQEIVIYSDEYELYKGKSLSKNALLNYLQEIGFAKTQTAGQKNAFVETTDSVLINSGEFKYPDKIIESEKFEVFFRDNQISEIYSHARNKQIPFVSLPPIKFTSVYSGLYTDYEPANIHEDVPLPFQKLLLLVEDKRFYNHFGFDPIGIFRAIWQNVQAGRVIQGASTITQQYVKNRFLNNERSLSRKIKELFISLILEIHFTKDQILQAYINTINLGQKGNYRVKGFQSASHFYFGQKLKHLNVAQMASLVALVKAPTTYKIINGNQKAIDRRNLVLKMALQANYINVRIYQTAIKTPLTYRSKQISTDTFGSYIGLIKNELKRDFKQFSWKDKKLTIFSNLDVGLQKNLQIQVRNTLKNIENKKKLQENSLESAVLVIDKNNGHIVASVANRNDQRFGWNRLLFMERSIGSLIKPFIYLTAVEELDYSLYSIVEDKKLSLKQNNGEYWSPKNYDNQTYGDVFLEDALAKSYNLAAVNLGLKVGVKNLSKRLKRAGYKKPHNPYASLFLGAIAMSPYEVAQLYQPLAAEGFSMPLKTVKQVFDAGSQTNTHSEFNSKQAFNSIAVGIIDQALSAVVKKGTARSLNWRLGSTDLLRGKTGTTNQLKDSWYVGYDDRYLIVVWVGRDDHISSGLSGSSGALVVYANIMKSIRQNR